MKIKREQKNLIKRAQALFLVWLLVAAAVVLVFPANEPGASAVLYHDNSAAAEDADHGGGLDHNGDPAGDKIVTWHPANNSHIVTADFTVNDGYVLELEAGVIVQSDPGARIIVGSSTGAAFYANGTEALPVMMGPNSTGVWGGIYLIFGSYGAIEYTWIDQSDLVYVSDSTLDVNATAITNSAQFGIYASGSTVTTTYTAIMNIGTSPGIYTLSSDLTASRCFISDAPIAAIYCDSSIARISYSDLYGFNSTSGVDGGNGVNILGSSSFVTISDNNNIVGGKGGDDVGAGGGKGGFGISVSGYDGLLSVNGNKRIEGGAGGNNTSPISKAGEGRMGIYISPVSDLGPSPSVNISGNHLIKGGRGGDNDALFDGSANNGGDAIYIIDNPPGSGGSVLISSNDVIAGGDGGHNFANFATTGWVAGEGGNGISLINIRTPAISQILQNPNIAGGAGGNNSGMGNFATPAGEGGHGVLLLNSTGVTASQNFMIGGHGGNNTQLGLQAYGGDGGNGLYLSIPAIGLGSSMATISFNTMFGGEGGDDYVGQVGPIKGGPGLGGNGMESYQSGGTCVSSSIFGGKGGDNFGIDGTGGQGGFGSVFSDSSAWTVTGGSMVGGLGGMNFDPTGGGGDGQSALYIYQSNGVEINTVAIIGGNGGTISIGTSGPGDAAFQTVYAANSDNLNIIENVVLTGVGGTNTSTGQWGQNGSYGIQCSNLGISNSLAGNTVTTDSKAPNKVGLFLNVSPAGSVTVAANNIYTNYFGIYVSNSDNVIIGDSNHIYDNFVGISLVNSDATIGKSNIIENNDFGISADNSKPTILGDFILNSSQLGLRFIQGSDAIVENTVISNSGIWNVYCEGAAPGSSPKFYNSTLSAGVGGGDFYQKDNSHPWLLNTSFDKSKTQFGDALSNLTVNWFMHVRVIDTGYVGVPSATIWINDSYGTNLYTLSSDGQGWVLWNVVTEYVENATGYEYYYSPYNVSALEGGRFGNAVSEMTMSRVVLVMLDGISFDIPLNQGWNLISIPVNQPSTKLEDILAPLSGRYKAVEWFNVSKTSDHWQMYHVSKSAEANDLKDIEKTMGIWILMASDDVLPVVGPIPVPPTTDIQLKAGWNLVGYPAITNRPTGNGAGEAFEFVTGAGTIDMVQYFDASDGANPWKEWDPGVFSPDDLTDIKTGMGLWIHVTDDCTWTVGW